MSDYAVLAPQVLAMFRSGVDTFAIGRQLRTREEIVERVLHSALAVQRFKAAQAKEEKSNGSS